MLSKLTSLHCLLSYLKACAIACGLGLGGGGGVCDHYEQGLVLSNH